MVDDGSDVRQGRLLQERYHCTPPQMQHARTGMGFLKLALPVCNLICHESRHLH